MMTVRGWGVLLACGLAVSPEMAAGAIQERIGSWVLSCPGETPRSKPCLMQFNKRFLDKAGLTGDLEVQARGGALVPVIALRGLPSELLAAASLVGKTEASLQLGGGAREALSCATREDAYVCVPEGDAGRKLAAELPGARTATVRVTVAVAGMNPLPAQEKSLELADTGAALIRLRALGPTEIPGPMAALASQSPSGLMAMADRALKAAGYPNGAASLQALVAKYMRQ
jgi:hypothetical protein